MYSNTVELLSYEACCDNCREAVLEMDSRRWLIGDTASVIKTRYSEHTIEDFAREIGINKSTAYQYCKVAEFYEPSLRRRLLEDMPNITYTYLRDAMRLEDVDLAVEWLERCSTEGWSVDQAAHQLAEKLGGNKSNMGTKGDIVRRYKQEDGFYIVVRFEREPKRGERLTITID